MSNKEVAQVTQEITHLLPDLANGDHTIARLLKQAKALIRNPHPFSPGEHTFLGFDGTSAFKVSLFGNQGFYNLHFSAGTASGIMENGRWIGDWTAVWSGGPALYPKGEVESMVAFTTHWPEVDMNDFWFSVTGASQLSVGCVVTDERNDRETKKDFSTNPDVPINDFSTIPVSFAGTRLQYFNYESRSGLCVARLDTLQGDLHLELPAAITKLNLS